MCFFCLSMSGLKDDAVFRALTHQLEERIPRANKQDVTNIMLALTRLEDTLPDDFALPEFQEILRDRILADLANAPASYLLLVYMTAPKSLALADEQVLAFVDLITPRLEEFTTSELSQLFVSTPAYRAVHPRSEQNSKLLINYIN